MLAANDASGVHRALHGEVPAVDLLSLRVKVTFNDSTDTAAFFHSIASYGLDFQLGDTAEQLAARNGLADALEALQQAAREAGGALADKRISAEASLLAAVAADDNAQIRQVFSQATPAADLLQLRVKETLNDSSDRSAFFHSVASFGLQFEIGDTILQLAERNGRHRAARALRRNTPITLREAAPPSTESVAVGADAAQSAEGSLHEGSNIRVVVRNSMTGEVVAELDASRAWTVGMLTRTVAGLSPVEGGCRVLLSGASPLTFGSLLADLAQDDDIIELSSVVIAVVAGTYKATIVADNDQFEALGGLRPVRPPMLGGWQRPTKITIKLAEDGTAQLAFEQHPFDRGHCAPPSGGRFVAAVGTWCWDVQGVVMTLTEGHEGRFIRGRRGSTGTWRQQQQIIMAMVHEGQFDVVDNQSLAGAEFSRPVACAPGAAFLKTEEE